MKRNVLILSAFTLFSVVGAKAQTLVDAIKLTQSERFEDASAAYKTLISSDASADAYFYFGDNFIKWEELDSARLVLGKGVAINANNPLLQIGLAKIAAIENKTAELSQYLAKANEQLLAQAKTLSKDKQALVYNKMSEVYLLGSSKNPDESIRLLRESEKLNAKDAETYILLGDAYFEKNVSDASESIKNYEKAATLDNSSRRAILRQGQLYTKVLNFEEALKFYNQAISLDPNFAPAYRERAELYYRFGKIAEGIEDYKKYLSINNSPDARKRYAVFLYTAKDYAGAVVEAKAVLAAGNTNPVLYRVLAYSSYETKAYAEGLANMEKFLSVAKADGKPKLISLDYAYYGKLLVENGKDSIGVLEILKAIELDPAYTDAYSDIAGVYYKQKKYAEAVKYYAIKNSKNTKANYVDLSALARSYYSNKDYKAADSTYALVAELLPNSPFAFLWRARSLNKLDVAEAPTGMAKPFYEKVIEIGSVDAEKNKKDLVEAYSYLGFYYFVQKDFSCAKSAWTKLKEIDPANEKAATALADKNIAAGTECELIKKAQP